MSIYQADKIETTGSGIEVRNGREENPKFRRIYSAKVTPEVSIECEARTFYGRSWNGELRQRNGDYVFFDPCQASRKAAIRFGM